ncbi:hypothetical protein IEQ34_001005 [Dendrobium chrysotoxum]|uniref:Uncharacterized protein n=1 Tax=Dendrobium chrysotoxum TaxID=161865 RepID=A0AAV7HM35_DENCH|nr:hypothetical protein IEQ34_001005 [Dendrobium chrysotoxum]
MADLADPRSAISNRGADDDTLPNRGKGGNGDAVLIQRKGDSSERDQQDIDSIMNRLINSGQYITIPTLPFEAGFVDCKVSFGGHPRCLSAGHSTNIGMAYKVPCSDSCDMCSMPVAIDRRSLPITGAECFRANKLVVAIGDGALALPFDRWGRNAFVVESKVGWGNASVNHADDDALSVEGLLPYASAAGSPIVEVEEFGSVGGMGEKGAVRMDEEEAVYGFHSIGFLRCKASSEASDGVAVRVE